MPDKKAQRFESPATCDNPESATIDNTTILFFTRSKSSKQSKAKSSSSFASQALRRLF